MNAEGRNGDLCRKSLEREGLRKENMPNRKSTRVREVFGGTQEERPYESLGKKVTPFTDRRGWDPENEWEGDSSENLLET